MSHTRRILTIAVTGIMIVFGFIFLIMMNQGKEESWEPNFSTYYTDPFGTHALYRILEAQGFKVKKNYYSFDKITDYGVDNYVILAPPDAFTDTETKTLMRWVIRPSFGGQIPILWL